MKVWELREALQEIARSTPQTPAAKRALKTFFTQIAGHDDMAIEDFLRLFRPKPPTVAPAPQGRPEPSEPQLADGSVIDQTVQKLSRALPDDRLFAAALAAAAADKQLTKGALTEVFLKLFDRTDGVPKKATRAELLRLIEDERLILVRNEKMGKLLGRRPVAAE